MDQRLGDWRAFHPHHHISTESPSPSTKISNTHIGTIRVLGKTHEVKNVQSLMVCHVIRCSRLAIPLSLSLVLFPPSPSLPPCLSHCIRQSLSCLDRLQFTSHLTIKPPRMCSPLTSDDCCLPPLQSDKSPSTPNERQTRPETCHCQLHVTPIITFTHGFSIQSRFKPTPHTQQGENAPFCIQRQAAWA